MTGRKVAAGPVVGTNLMDNRRQWIYAMPVGGKAREITQSTLLADDGLPETPRRPKFYSSTFASEEPIPNGKQTGERE
jgi:hypothetical protein